MPLWKVVFTYPDQGDGEKEETRIVRAERRAQVESYLLQAYEIERIKDPAAMLELRDIEVEDIQ